jgi:uncharacterized protein YciI
MRVTLSCDNPRVVVPGGLPPARHPLPLPERAPSHAGCERDAVSLCHHSAFNRFPESEPKVHYLLIYEVGDDYVEKRQAWRGEHLALAQAAVARGELVLGGALAEPADRAILLFCGDSPAVAEAFAQRDPYVLNGLVQRWEVRPWMTVVGRDAQLPLPRQTNQESGPDPSC